MIIISPLNVMTSKYTTLIGDGSATVFNITQGTHHLENNGSMIVQVSDAVTGDKIEVNTAINNTNGTVTITFATPPPLNAYRVVIIS